MVCAGKRTRGPATSVPIIVYTHYVALVPLESAGKGEGVSTGEGKDGTEKIAWRHW